MKTKKLQTNTVSANGNGLIAYTENAWDLTSEPGMVTGLPHDSVCRYGTAVYISVNRGQGF